MFGINKYLFTLHSFFTQMSIEGSTYSIYTLMYDIAR